MPCRYSAACGARSSNGRPPANSSTSPICTRARSRSKSTPARPATATSRPQFGSAPWTAVFTSGELAIARAARLASSSDARAGHVDRDQLGRAFAAADDADRQRLADRAAAPRPAGRSSASPMRTPLAPFASANTQSLVEHSPSTVMALNVSSAAAVSARCSSAGVDLRVGRDERRASSPSAARSCPEPLAMPPTRKAPAARRDLDRGFLRETDRSS